MVGPDETLVQQFRVRGCLGIDRLQLEHHHIFTPSLLVSLLFLELVSRLRWPSRDALTFITHSTQFPLRILVHIKSLSHVEAHHRATLRCYCQASRIVILSGARESDRGHAPRVKSHPPPSRVDPPSGPPDHRERKRGKRGITFSSKILRGLTSVVPRASEISNRTRQTRRCRCPTINHTGRVHTFRNSSRLFSSIRVKRVAIPREISDSVPLRRRAASTFGAISLIPSRESLPSFGDTTRSVDRRGGRGRGGKSGRKRGRCEAGVKRDHRGGE